MTSVADRFWAKVNPAPADQCWDWLAGVKSSGYGSFWNGERNVVAHRWAYEALVGPIPDGLQLDHLCRNRRCVNPWHLDPVTNHVNVLRGVAGQHMRAKAAEITHCPQGHPFDAENTRLSRTDGRRRCRKCEAIRDHRRYWQGRTPTDGPKTHCINGHEYTPENTRTWRGARICRACDRARHAAASARRQLTDGATR